jgi:hypothetical protein
VAVSTTIPGMPEMGVPADTAPHCVTVPFVTPAREQPPGPPLIAPAPEIDGVTMTCPAEAVLAPAARRIVLASTAAMTFKMAPTPRMVSRALSCAPRLWSSTVRTCSILA